MPTSNKSPEQARKYFEAKIAFTAGPVEVSKMIKSGDAITIIDVRDKKDFDEGHVPGAISMPQSKWQSMDGPEKEKLNVVYCYSIVCHLAARAAVEMASRGFRVMEMDGGFKEWQAHKLDVETSARQAS